MCSKRRRRASRELFKRPLCLPSPAGACLPAGVYSPSTINHQPSTIDQPSVSRTSLQVFHPKQSPEPRNAGGNGPKADSPVEPSGNCPHHPIAMSSISLPSEILFTPVEQIPKFYQDVSQNSLTGATRCLEWREHQLKQLAYLLQENESLLEDALLQDLGRPRLESHIIELDSTKSEVLYALSHLRKWVEPTKADTDLTWSISKPKIFHEPKGIVLIFGAWNYPVALLIGPLIGAIAAGNSVIIKPSENSPATCNLLTTLLQRYMDPNHVCVINGAQEQCSALLELRFDHIFFTGSLAIGKIIARKAAETLTPVTLELGGKSPVIVLDDANFEVMAKRIVWAKIVNAGQTCIAPDYILVSENSEARLIEAMKVALKTFYPASSEPQSGSPPDSKYCKIVNRSHFDRLTSCLSQTKGQIVKIDSNTSIQPNAPDPDSLRIPFTLIRDVKTDDVLMQDELFGPLLPIMTYKSDGNDLLQHLKRINQSSPLAIYAFSQNKEKLEFLRKNSKSGQFICNDLLIQFVVQGLPFGGVGTSGLGNYHGYHSFLTFTYERSSLDLPSWAEILIGSRYPPYTPFKSKLLKLLTGGGSLKGQSNPHPPVPDSSTRTSKL